MNERRQFLHSFFRSALESYEMFKGAAPKFKLSDVESFDAEKLGQVVPEIRAGQLRLDQDGKLHVLDGESGQAHLLCRIGTEQQLAYGYFTGDKDINAIAAALAEDLHISPADAFRHAKDLFLLLTKVKICFPKNLL